MRLPHLSIVALATLLHSYAIAAPDPANRGFAVGDKSRIHVNLNVGVGYDTNPGRGGEFTVLDDAERERTSAGDAEAADAKLQLRPGFDINVPGREFTLGLGAKFSLEQFFGTSDGTDSNTEYGGDAHVSMTAGAPDSTLGLELDATLARSPTFFDDLGTDGASELRNAFWALRGRLNTVIRPGGGALEFRLGYSPGFTLYDSLPNDQHHAIGLEAKLRFLPKTAALFAAQFGFYDDSDDEAAVQDATRRRKANPYSVELGLQGQLTENLTATARVGFGDALVWKTGEDFFGESFADTQRTVIAKARLQWAFDEKKDIWLGYNRRVVPVVMLRSFVGDAIQLGTNIGVGDNLGFGLQGELEFRDYADRELRVEIRNDGTNALVDARDITAKYSAMRVKVDARIEYWFFDFLNAQLVYQLAMQAGKNGGIPDPGAGNSLKTNDPDGILLVNDYTKHLALLVIGFHY